MSRSYLVFRRLFFPIRPAVCLAVCVIVLGCGEETLEFTEIKRIDEKVTDSDLQTFLRIIKSLPDQKLPETPPIFAPPPDWNQTRTLPVGELVSEEQKLIAERWSPEWMARHLQRNRPLARALRREGMTLEQFVGLTLVIGVALARQTLHDDQDLEKLRENGHTVIAQLKRDNRPYSSLRLDAKHYILQQAAWIARVDRVKRLRQVPPENIALVRSHLETLEPIFPAEFTTNPLDAVADLLEEQGLPFEELTESGSDAEIDWNPDEADIGTDQPDEEFVIKKEATGPQPTQFPTAK